MNYPHRITREKHLNHLTRVVPLLALAYGVQSFLMMKWSQEGSPTGFLVLLLGVSLAASVMVLVTYDQRHQVTFGPEGFRIQTPWFWRHKEIPRDHIKQITVIGEADQFQSVIVDLKDRRRLVFHFADNGEEFKSVLLKPQFEEKLAA